MRRWVAAVVLVTAASVGVPVAAGAKSGKPPVKATTAVALADAMADRGLACDPFLDSADSPGPGIPGGPPQGDSAECVLDGVTGSIAVYDSARELGRALDAMPVFCGIATVVLGPVAFTFVTGKNWSISFFRDEYDPAVGKALGGKVRDVDCTKVANG